MLIRIEKNKVSDIYDGLSEDTIAQLKSAFIDSEFVETEEPVNRGDVWPKVVAEIPESPQPQTKTRETVVMELNSLVDQKKRQYLQRWPQAIQSDLWPLFSDEITRLNASQDEATAALYPALAGALSVKLGIETSELTSGQISGFAAAIVGAKSAHAIELAKLEECYQSTLTAWITNPEIDIKTAFEVAYGA